VLQTNELFVAPALPQSRESRAQEALQLRIKAAQSQYEAPLSRQEINGDSEKCSTYWANYSKGFSHDSAGLLIQWRISNCCKHWRAAWPDFFRGQLAKIAVS